MALAEKCVFTKAVSGGQGGQWLSSGITGIPITNVSNDETRVGAIGGVKAKRR